MKADAPAPFLDEVFCDPQAEPGSDFPLGSEERSKEFLLVVRRNANSVIGYGDANSVLARLKMPRGSRTNFAA